MLNTRSGLRREIRTTVILHNFSESEEIGEICNISYRGAFIETRHPAEIQSCFVIKMVSPEAPTKCLYQTAAIVAHRQSDGIGVMLPEGAGDIVQALTQPSRKAQQIALNG